MRRVPGMIGGLCTIIVVLELIGRFIIGCDALPPPALPAPQSLEVIEI